MIRKNKKYVISLIFILFFVFYFIYLRLLHGDIIVLPSLYIRPFSERYFSWYWNDYFVDTTSSEIVMLGYLTRIIFSLIFSLDILYILNNKSYKAIIGFKNILIYFGVGILTYLIFIIFLNYKITHYKLYMILYPTLILTMISLIMNLKLMISSLKKQNIKNK